MYSFLTLNFLRRIVGFLGCVFKGHEHCISLRSQERLQDDVRQALHRPWFRTCRGGGGVAGFVGTVVPTPVPRSRSGAAIGGSGGSAGGGAAGSAGVSTGVEEMLDFGADGGMEIDATHPKPKKPKGPPRGAQHCFHWGHRRQEGAYKEAHLRPLEKGGRYPCNVSPGEYRSEACRVGKRRPDGKRSWSRCDCEECTAGSITVA